MNEQSILHIVFCFQFVNFMHSLGMTTVNALFRSNYCTNAATQCMYIIIRINGEIDILPLLFYCSFIFLFLEHYGVRKLEAVFAVLIGTMAISFAWMFGDTKPNGKELLIGTKIDFVCLLIRGMESY